MLNLKDNGFSLIEIMIVVVLVAILTTIAIPTYQGFLAKARQKEGFALLNTYFAAAQTTRAEFGAFPGNFVQTGFAPVGQLGYRLFAQNNPAGGSNIFLGWDDPLCIRTESTCDCVAGGGPTCPGFKTWNEKPPGTPGSSLGPSQLSVGICGGVTEMTDTTFRVFVSGVINLNAVSRDVYQIDHLKSLSLCLDGLR